MKTNQNAITQIMDGLFREYVNESAQQGLVYTEESQQVILCDLLTDIRHYCRQQGLDFELALRLSEMHFEAEIEDA